MNVTETADKVVEGFPCDICDFTSSWKNGLAIHMSRKHSVIEQLDGNSDHDADNDDQYSRTQLYWKTGCTNLF